MGARRAKGTGVVSRTGAWTRVVRVRSSDSPVGGGGGKRGRGKEDDEGGKRLGGRG